MAKARILLVEDDAEIRELVRLAFAREGWELLEAEDGEKGLGLAASALPDAAVLDIMLPGLDGMSVLRRLKADPSTSRIPVIMTTARGEDSDIIAGLELGADDYVVKPFSPKVLAARVRAALRRRAEAQEEASGGPGGITRGPFTLDEERFEVFRDGERLEFSATEFAIFALLLRNPGRVFSRSTIIEAVKGPDYPVTDRSVDVQVLQLRKKLGDASEWIETVRGVGYRFKD